MTNNNEKLNKCCDECIDFIKHKCKLCNCHSSPTQSVEEITTDTRKIGMLRQWLNEDRITDVNKMVTNEDILQWLR